MTDEAQLMKAEFVVLSSPVNDRFLAERALWLNPLGSRSECMSVQVPILSADGREVLHCDIIVGWKCQRCYAVLFATSIEGLRHEPCCYAPQ